MASSGFWTTCKHICTSLQTDNHASFCSIFYRAAALPDAQPKCRNTEGRISTADSMVNFCNKVTIKISYRTSFCWIILWDIWRLLWLTVFEWLGFWVPLCSNENNLEALGQCIPPPRLVLPVSRYQSRHLANQCEWMARCSSPLTTFRISQ